MAEASRADSKAIVLRQHEEVWSQGNLAAVDDIYAANFVGHHPGMPGSLGPEGVKEAVPRFAAPFPTLRNRSKTSSSQETKS